MHPEPLRVIGTLLRHAQVTWRTSIASIDTNWIGDMAAEALLAELDTWPKPGLVSPVDNGSHSDMDYATFLRSIDALRPFFRELAAAGAAAANIDELRRIGRLAEEAMLAATNGVNTHRGAIFALGLLCAAAGEASCKPTAGKSRLSAHSLALTVGTRWGDDILRGPIPLNSHGSAALRHFGAGGARVEAANGFPRVRTIGLPALQAGQMLAEDQNAARVNAFFALMGAVEDTNLLHRGGVEALQEARVAAMEFALAGGVARTDWLTDAVALHRRFVAKNLSPGGSADLLAVTIFLDLIGGGL